MLLNSLVNTEAVQMIKAALMKRVLKFSLSALLLYDFAPLRQSMLLTMTLT